MLNVVVMLCRVDLIVSENITLSEFNVNLVTLF